MDNKSTDKEVTRIFSKCHRCNSKRLKFVKEKLLTDPITEQDDTHEAMVCEDCTAAHYIENGQVTFQWDKVFGNFSEVRHCPSDYELAIAEKAEEPIGRISGHSSK